MGRAGWWAGLGVRAQGSKHVWHICGWCELRFEAHCLAWGERGSVGVVGAATALHAAMWPRRAVQAHRPGCAVHRWASNLRPTRECHDRTAKPRCPQACKIKAAQCAGIASPCSPCGRAVQDCGVRDRPFSPRPFPPRPGQAGPVPSVAPSGAATGPAASHHTAAGEEGVLQGRCVTLLSIRTWHI